MKAEEAESISGRTGRLFEDLHFVWAALGATGATVACVALIYLISLFAILPPAGYNKNPVVPERGDEPAERVVEHRRSRRSRCSTRTTSCCCSMPS